jgi:hypothetical protein
MMPSISVEVNGKRIATIDLTGMHVVDVSVHGGLDFEQAAVLSAGGGNHSDGLWAHLIWIAENALVPGEVVSMRFHETCGIGDKGKTIQELYPDEDPSTKSDFTISDEMAAELRSRPRLHEAFIVQVGTSMGHQAKATSDDLNTDFRLGLLWDHYHPNQVRVRLATHCLDDVLARTGGTEHLKTMLCLGDAISFSLVG